MLRENLTIILEEATSLFAEAVLGPAATAFAYCSNWPCSGVIYLTCGSCGADKKQWGHTYCDNPNCNTGCCFQQFGCVYC